MQRIAFANALRGVAALCVVIAHYILMFNYIRGEFGGLPALPETPFPTWMINVFNPLNSLNVGAFGVALFFLISGLVIPISVSNLDGQFLARIKFTIGRLLRIWPTYIVGLLITLASLEASARYMGNTTSYTLKQVIIQISLFRDWLGNHQPLDGVVWTLEIEIKFYIAILIFWPMINKAKILPFITLGFLTILIANLYPGNTYRDGTLATLTPPIKYVFYMMIGVSLNYHYRKLISLEKTLALNIAMLFIFGYSCLIEGWQVEIIVSYFAAFALFTTFYLLAREWRGGPVFNFLANISYPLYTCHGAFGIVGMRIMIDQGAGAITALVIQTTMTIILSWIIHKTIENPTQTLGKRLTMMIRSPTAPIAAS